MANRSPLSPRRHPSPAAQATAAELVLTQVIGDVVLLKDMIARSEGACCLGGHCSPGQGFIIARHADC